MDPWCFFDDVLFKTTEPAPASGPALCSPYERVDDHRSTIGLILCTTHKQDDGEVLLAFYKLKLCFALLTVGARSSTEIDDTVSLHRSH